jgi:tryptophan-rich sensory protein
MKLHVGKLIVSIIVCQLAGLIGGLWTKEAVRTWYQTIEKPGFTPPGWVFGPVWILLYLLMGIALYLVWQSAAAPTVKTIALAVFGVQLVLNALWSYFFFYSQNPRAGFIEIVILWIFIVLTIFLFYGIHKGAAMIMLPYLLWVTFAAYLNYAIWMLNR